MTKLLAEVAIPRSVSFATAMMVANRARRLRVINWSVRLRLVLLRRLKGVSIMGSSLKDSDTEGR